jgi:hypothetical protein
VQVKCDTLSSSLCLAVTLVCHSSDAVSTGLSEISQYFPSLVSYRKPFLTYSMGFESELPKNFPLKIYCRVHKSLSWFLSWARLIRYILHHTVLLRSVISFHLRLGLPMRSSPFALDALPISLTWSFWIYLTKVYKLWSSSLCSFLQPPVIPTPFGPNILFSTRPLTADTKFYTLKELHVKLVVFFLCSSCF